MNWIPSILGLVIVLTAAGVIAAGALPRARQSRGAFRFIPAAQRLRRALGLAVEDGTRVHVSLGKAGLTTPEGASALAGLSALERVAQLSSVSDRPPVATSGDGALAILSQDTLRAAHRAANAPELYDPDRGRLTGPTPMSFVAGALPILSDERVSANLLIGNFGPEAALLAEAAERQGAFTLAASDALPTQAVFFALSDEPLVGEELFALPAYLQAGPAHQFSLRAQDLLRWGIVLLMIVLGLLAVFGVLVL